MSCRQYKEVNSYGKSSYKESCSSKRVTKGKRGTNNEQTKSEYFVIQNCNHFCCETYENLLRRSSDAKINM